MNSELSSSCRCFGLYDENNIVGFIGVLHQPHGKNPRIKRCSRLVILPDYQGIGLGYKFLNIVAQFYTNQGYDFSIVTSAKNFVSKLAKSDEWGMRKVGYSKCGNEKSKIDYKRASMRSDCKTASFYYKK